jgi:predicted TIM-barrel fold metal-dependent hydrolase
MIIDLNASLGPYPFRRLPATTAVDLIGQMDRAGIDRAVVTSLPAVFYRDVHQGNAALRVEIEPHRARLIPVATLNPKYPGWERDLAEALGPWRMKAVALWPEYHCYTLAGSEGRAALAAIAAAGVPVMLTQRLEDRRQRHAWDQAEDLSVASLLEAARAHPRLRFLLVNWAGLDGPKLAAAGLRGRCLIDFARLQVVNRKEVAKLIAALGVESVGFGSHLPFDYAGPALVKLANLEGLPAADYERIAWRNAAAMLGLG